MASTSAAATAGASAPRPLHFTIPTSTRVWAIAPKVIGFAVSIFAILNDSGLKRHIPLPSSLKQLRPETSLCLFLFSAVLVYLPNMGLWPITARLKEQEVLADFINTHPTQLISKDTADTICRSKKLIDELIAYLTKNDCFYAIDRNIKSSVKGGLLQHACLNKEISKEVVFTLIQAGAKITSFAVESLNVRESTLGEKSEICAKLEEVGDLSHLDADGKLTIFVWLSDEKQKNPQIRTKLLGDIEAAKNSLNTRIRNENNGNEDFYSGYLPRLQATLANLSA